MQTVDFKNINTKMKLLPQWVNYKHENKIPLNPNIFTHGSSLETAKANDPTTWASYITAKKRAVDHGYGIGFEFAENDPYVGIDLDHCIENGKPLPWAQEIVDYCDSYTEVSPSGTGLHIILKGKFEGSGRKKADREVYREGRYFTVTGNKLNDNPIIENQKAIERFIADSFPEPIPTTPLRIVPSPANTDSEQTILNKLKNHKKFQKIFQGDISDYPSVSEADMALCSFVSQYTHDPSLIESIYHLSAIDDPKWNSKRKKTTYGRIIIQKVLSNAPPLRKVEIIEEYDREDVLQYEPFPIEIMSGLAGDFAEAQAKCIEAPEHFLFMGFLTCLGSMLSEKLTLKKSLFIQPRLYTLLLGESASSRKSTTMRVVINFFRETFKENGEVNLSVGLGYGSGEGLQKGLEANNNLLLYFDEFKSFVSKATIKSSVLLTAVTQLFENNEYENQTKTSHLKIRNAHLSMLAASTIDTYERTWDSSFSDIGFTNRLFLVVGDSERKFAFPRKLDVKTSKELQTRLKDMVYGLDGGRLELEFTQEGWVVYEAWYHNREDSVYARRLDTYAIRLMLLIAVNDGKKYLDADVVDKAIKLCEWQLGIRKSLSPIDADNDVARMEEKIRRQLSNRGSLTKRELAQFTHANRAGLWIFNTAIENLINAEDIIPQKMGKTEVYRKNKV